jgi:multidrug efflux pump subunit AcrB
VSAGIAEGYNATLLSRDLSVKLDEYRESGALPYGYSLMIDGESSTVNDMVSQMVLLIALGGLCVYLVMVAQFQSLLSPFIVLFTVPLAFTGGMIGLIVAGEQLSLLSLMGFALLMGTVVNNGIVYVDYVNQLRQGGLDRRSALIATGKTRMRPILMTALTTILAMFQMIISDDMAGQLGRGMSIVVVGGMIYATVMTLVIVPVVYDLLFKREPRVIDVGGDNLDDVPDDAAEFIAQALAEEEARKNAETSEELPAETPAEEATEVPAE